MWTNKFEIESQGNLRAFFEPLNTKAPASAYPYCCYIDTVIFYQDKTMEQELDRVSSEWDLLGLRYTEEDIGFSATAPFVYDDGRVYELRSGTAVWHNGGWHVRWLGKLVPKTDPRLWTPLMQEQLELFTGGKELQT